MKSPFGIRLWLLIAAIVGVGGSTICGLSFAWRRIELVENKLTRAYLESFRLADEVQHRLLTLNNSMLRYTTLRDAKEWEKFQEASGQFDRWIDQYDPSQNSHSVLSTDAERRLFQELNRTYDDYLAVARQVHTNGQPGLASSQGSTQLAAFEAQAERLAGLGSRLALAHRAAEDSFLAGANRSLSNLRGFLIAAVVLLLALIAALGWVIFRDAIAPLRTKLVQSQTLLEKQEKLATLGTLAAGIAHEIRNPLTSLKARLYTLEKHLQAAPAARKDTAIISAEISRLERIVQDVLSFARPSEPEFKIVSADGILRKVQGLMAPSLANRHVQLVVESTPALSIRADSAHLKQVLINLVRNAAEAIEEEGTVTLRVRSGRAILAGRESAAAILEVSDTGQGIPPEVEKRLFDPFFSTKETGTGLGLSIAARMVERHGGTLQYQTRVGRGTTFGVVLPLAVGETEPRADSEPA